MSGIVALVIQTTVFLTVILILKLQMHCKH